MFKLGGLTISCRSNPYGNVASFQRESIVTVYCPGDAMDDKVFVSRVLLPDISVELRRIGVLCLGGLGSPDDCST